MTGTRDDWRRGTRRHRQTMVASAGARISAALLLAAVVPAQNWMPARALETRDAAAMAWD